VDKDSLSKSSHITSTIKYVFAFITIHCWTKNSIKVLLTHAHCACARSHSFPTVLQTLLQPLQASSKLSICCWLRQLKVCPQYSQRWNVVATSWLLHIVDKFYKNIMPLRPMEIHNFQFPRICDGILAYTQTSQVGPTLASIKKMW
jgi:hypothetical protein